MAGIDPDTQAFDYDVEDDESDDDDVDDDAVDGLPSRFEGEDLEELAEQTRLSLETGALPDYHHIRAVVLLAFIVEYCCHPENRRSEAETLRAWSRRFHPEGLDASVDAVLADLRRMLDSIDEVLKSEKSTYDSEDDDMQPVCDDMGDLEDADEVLWAEQDDPQELIHAGEEALAVTSEFEEKMRIGEGRARNSVSEDLRTDYKPSQHTTQKPPSAGEERVPFQISEETLVMSWSAGDRVKASDYAQVEMKMEMETDNV